MKYIVCLKPGKFEVREKEVPQRGKDEALVKINKIGICGTDLHAYQGNQPYFSYPRVLGHELAATVVQVGENPSGLNEGDKVVVMPYISCLRCVACRSGKTNCCTQMQVLGVHIDGGMQEYLSLPTELLLPANHLSEKERAIVEPLAIGAHALSRAALKRGETVTVIGCGPIGIGIIIHAKMAGAEVIALDHNKHRLRFAREVAGADHSIRVSEDTAGRVSEITGGAMATVVFDATGNKKALEAAPDLASHGGRFVIVGLSKGSLEFMHPAIHAKELSLLCSRNATLEDFKFVMDRLDQFPTASYVTHELVFDTMIAHFDALTGLGHGLMKAMVSI